MAAPPVRSKKGFDPAVREAEQVLGVDPVAAERTKTGSWWTR
jgi:hypothetical protein